MTTLTIPQSVQKIRDLLDAKQIATIHTPEPGRGVTHELWCYRDGKRLLVLVDRERWEVFSIAADASEVFKTPGPAVLRVIRNFDEVKGSS